LDTLITILPAWLLADFLAGLVHWYEDHYLDNDSRFSFINRLSRDNDNHHWFPNDLAYNSFWQNINTTVYIAGPLCLILLLIGAPTIFWLTAFFGSFANAVHAAGHRPYFSHNYIVRFFQWTGLFISFKHHKTHHYKKWRTIKKQDTTIRFCPMTNWLNPILDYVNFFGYLGKLFYFIGIKNTKQRAK